MTMEWNKEIMLLFFFFFLVVANIGLAVVKNIIYLYNKNDMYI